MKRTFVLSFYVIVGLIVFFILADYAFTDSGFSALWRRATVDRIQPTHLADTTRVNILRAHSINLGDTTAVVLTQPGAATITVSNLIIDTFGAAALDTAVTLTAVTGHIVFISTRIDAHDVAFLDAGNFTLGAERVLSDADDVLVLKATSATTWKEISFANNQ